MKKIIALLTVFVLAVSALPFSALAKDTNVALGKEYTVTSEANIDNAYPNEAYSDKAFALTDGKKGSATDANNNWISFYRGLSKSIVIDLGKEVYINKINIGFLNINEWGINAPRTVKFSVSSDGESFSTVYEKRDDAIMASKKKERVQWTYTADGYYSARYVKVYFTCDVYCYADEIEVFGTDQKPAKVLKVTPDKEESFYNEFAPNTNPLLDGADNVVLIYNGKYYQGAENDIGSHDKSGFLPFAAYVDKNNKYTDTMFDSFLFLPLNPGESEGSLKTQKGWEIYLENTIGYSENPDNYINLYALNEQIGEIKKNLGLTDYKVNIFMTVPELIPNGSAFGTVNGKSVKTNNLQDCKEIVKWYVDLSEKTFNEQGFEHLNLTGFYWYSELVRYSASTFDTDLIKYFTDYCHEKEHAAVWIPYYGAPGFWESRELGFDVAALQSGYAFPKEEDSATGNPKQGACYDSMSIAKKYGMGVEIELQLVDDAAERYTDYLVQSYLLGCMEKGVSFYYQAGGDGELYRCAYSGSSDFRGIYDMTYSYIKGTFAISAPYLEYEGEINLIIDATNERNRGKLPVRNDSLGLGELKLNSLIRPEKGELTFEANGFFFYVPEENDLTKQHFSFSLTNGMATSEEYTVNLIIVDGALRITDEGGKLRDDKAVLYVGEKSAPQNESAYEFAVDAYGKVVSAGETNGIAIPEGGYVVATSGEKAAWVKANVSVGDTAVYDEFTGNLAFFGEGEDNPISTPSDTEDEGSVIIPALIGGTAVVIIAVTIFVLIKKKKAGEK